MEKNDFKELAELMATKDPVIEDQMEEAKHRAIWEMENQKNNVGKFDYTALEEFTKKIKKEALLKHPINICFDLESGGLEKFKGTMTMRSFETNAVHEIPKIPPFEQPKDGPIVIAAGGCYRGLAKHFPLMPPPGMKAIVFDSFSDLKMAELALRHMGQVGINAAQAGTRLKDAMNEMNKLNYGGKQTKINNFINESDDVLYSKKQASRWANNYSHKRPKKL